MNNGKRKSRFHYAYLVLLACVIVTGLPGAMIMNCPGVFFTPVSSYFGVPKAEFTLYFSIINITAMVYLPLCGKIMDRVNLRYFMSVAVLLAGVTYILMSFFTAIWMFYAAGVVLGIALTPIMFLGTPLLMDRWCVKNVGLFIGIGAAASGIGGAIFNIVGASLCSLSVESWRTGYFVFGCLILVVALPFAFFFMRSRPSDLGMLPFGADEQPEKQVSGEVVAAPVLGVSANTATKTIAFLAIAMFSFVLSICQTVYQYFASYCQASTIPEVVASAGAVAAACMIGQALGKVFLGSLSDRHPKLGIGVGVACGIAGLLIMWLAPFGLVAVVIGSFLFGGLYSCNAVHAPLLLRSVFGSRCFGELNSRRIVFVTLSFAFATEFWGVIVDMPNGYDLMFVAAIAFSLLCGAFGLFACSKIGAYEWTEK